MYITQITDDLSRASLIDLFGLSAVMGVEAALREKSGKPYVQCLVRKKDVQAKREELARQLWRSAHWAFPASCAGPARYAD